MASSVLSSTAIASRATAAQASMVAPFTGLKSTASFPVTRKSADFTSIATNGSKVQCMQVWPPYGKKKFETLSYLPTMSTEQLLKQVEYLLNNGWVPCLEFETEVKDSFIYLFLDNSSSKFRDDNGSGCTTFTTDSPYIFSTHFRDLHWMGFNFLILTSVLSGVVECPLRVVQKGFVYRECHSSPGYYDGRYWTMWKLPMFGCTDATQVVAELEECKKAYPGSWVRILGFDNVRQVQCIMFIAYKPHD